MQALNGIRAEFESFIWVERLREDVVSSFRKQHYIEWFWRPRFFFRT